MPETSVRLAGIEPPEQPLSALRLIRTVIDNPIKAWPRDLYRSRLYRSRVFGRDTVFVMAPDLIRTVLLDEADNYERGEIPRRTLGSLLGEGILLADWPRWRWQRRAVAAVFRQERIRDYLPAMIAGAQRTRERWQALLPGTEIDVAREMMRLTFDIILNTMLSEGGSVDIGLMETSISDLLGSTTWALALTMIGAPRWAPFPGKRRARIATERLHRMVEKLIAEARTIDNSRTDLLALLTKATDPETGRAMDALDVRNNLLTFIMAGHETTALALTWTFYLLSLHPEIEVRVKQEIIAVTGGGRVDAKHVEALAYTNQVIQEAMRLYPPVALMARTARRDAKIGADPIRAGTTIYLPIYALHRHEELWREPDRFDPDRFEPQAVAARDRFAYLPFGAGPRICIGQGFAQIEAVAVLATLLPSCTLRLRPGHSPEPRLRVTLRPAGGMPMRIAD